MINRFKEICGRASVDEHILFASGKEFYSCLDESGKQTFLQQFQTASDPSFVKLANLFIQNK
jgi:hypothetical protein